MISAPPDSPPQAPATQHFEYPLEGTSAARGLHWDFAEQSLTRTAAALEGTGAASVTDIARGLAAVRKSIAAGRPADLLEEIARIQGHVDEQLASTVLELGDTVAASLPHCQTVIPFAIKLITPAAFYDTFAHIHRTAKVLLAPVLYAEDTYAFGAASVNPMAAVILADEIRTTVMKRFGIRPFVSIARLDYESWVFLSHKHFEL
jgi:hypothetical protein